jgi:hypothetical protein
MFGERDAERSEEDREALVVSEGLQCGQIRVIVHGVGRRSWIGGRKILTEVYV